MKIALVHDDLVQWGGAERVLEALSEIFPEAPIYTLVYDKENKILKEKFGSKKIITSFIQKIPQWKKIYKPSFFLHPLAFEQFDFTGFDLVISQTTRFAKSILTKPETKHICFCHTPPRFLWGFSGEKKHWYFNFLQKFDKVSSYRVDSWIAGSKNAQNRIKQVYGFDSKVTYPFVDIEKFKDVVPFDGGYLLVVSRLNAYKRIDLAIKAANQLKMPLKIVGIGPEIGNLQKIAHKNVEFLGMLDEKMLNLVLSGCKALIIAGEEDFGLTSLEAQVLGKPVIAFKKGGALETVLEGETGYLFEEQTVSSLEESLKLLEKNGYNQERCLTQAKKFSKQKFMKEFRDLANFL
ncbi:MAG: glycosyltransferase [Candidatus Daviesbacteria bacterium]|nr:glycosyltransferase [Candidatus Daviesbacteria bacterium]